MEPVWAMTTALTKCRRWRCSGFCKNPSVAHVFIIADDPAVADTEYILQITGEETKAEPSSTAATANWTLFRVR